MVHKAPLSDAIIVAVGRLVDDAQAGQRRDPSHHDIELRIKQAGLRDGDPRTQGQMVGKRKRVSSTLSWALENNPDGGEKLVATLVAHIKGCGGFRSTSENYVGEEAIQNAAEAFEAEGYELATDGELRPKALDSLSGTQLTDALKAYVLRAQRGIQDAALVTGTGKDLLEATAAHVLEMRTGCYPQQSNFPTLLAQAFMELGFAIPAQPGQPAKSALLGQSGSPAIDRFERAMYDLGCAINGLRNKQGTGHGRPWLPIVTKDQAKVALEHMGAITQRMLQAL